jgi:hypothetical protein
MRAASHRPTKYNSRLTPVAPTHATDKRECERNGQPTTEIRGAILDGFAVLANETRIALDAAACWRVHPSKGSDHWGLRADLHFKFIGAS